MPNNTPLLVPSLPRHRWHHRVPLVWQVMINAERHATGRKVSVVCLGHFSSQCDGMAYWLCVYPITQWSGFTAGNQANANSAGCVSIKPTSLSHCCALCRAQLLLYITFLRQTYFEMKINKTSTHQHSKFIPRDVVQTDFRFSLHYQCLQLGLCEYSAK